ncbi:hypothetical protein D3C78_1138650 [compost metagenome]
MLGAAVVHGDGVVALGDIAQVLHVAFRAGPPDRVHLVARIAAGLRFADGGRRHDAGAPQQHVVRARLADLQPGGLLFNAGGGDRIQHQLEAFLGGALLQQRDRFLAIGRVVVDQGDLLALELVHAAFFLGDVLDHHVGGGPVRAQQREVPLEHAAVHRLRQAVAHRFDGHLVDHGLVADRERDAGGLGVEARSPGALALQAFIAFHAAIGGVGRFTFFVRDLDAVDAAIALIDQLQVVQLAIGPGNAQRRERPGAIHQQRNELLFGRHCRRGHGADGAGCGNQCRRQLQVKTLHLHLPPAWCLGQ